MTSGGKVAVIDVGSNSCRLVIYERSGAAFLPYFNEKVMAGLGRGLPETGALSPEGRKAALDTFRRFSAILKGLEVKTCHAVATAAVREASDGASFGKAAEKALGMPLRVLTGAEEGRASALGVAAGFRKSKGLVVDLGGSSLELHPGEKSQSGGKGETYLLGPLARKTGEKLSLSKQREAIRKALEPSALLPVKTGRLFAVGGAWRMIASVHKALRAYPLGVTHGYKLPREGLLEVIDAAQAADDNGDLKRQLQRIAKRRYDTITHAALVLDVLLERAELETVHISAYGLREGLLVPEEEVPAENRLLDTVELYFRLSADNAAFGKGLYDFLAPVLETVEQHKAVLKATCLMADAGARMHPDLRSQQIFDQVLRAPTPQFSHTERLFAAHAVASRYSFKYQMPAALAALIGDEERASARMVGTAMRLGGVYSGRSARILRSAQLSRTGQTLTLSVLKPHRDMVSEAVRRRHQQLANLMQLDPELKTIESV